MIVGLPRKGEPSTSRILVVRISPAREQRRVGREGSILGWGNRLLEGVDRYILYQGVKT